MDAILQSIAELSNAANARPGAKKVIILLTDGTPSQSPLMELPSGIKSWCQSNGHAVGDNTKNTVCASKYAQSTTGPVIPKKTCSSMDWMCSAMEELTPLGATVITVGVNAASYMDQFFQDVASDVSLYLKITNINSGNLEAMINDLLNKACPAVNCICKENTPWGPCDSITGLQTNNCIPTQLPLKGGAPCVSPTRPCGDCVWHWGPYGECDQTTGLKKRSPVVTKQPVPPDGIVCPTGDQFDQCIVDCQYKWGDYQGTCTSVGDEQTRQAVCPTSPTPTPTSNPCPPIQPINGGTPCPSPQAVPCGIKPCLFTWPEWTTCGDPSVGKQKREATVTQQPEGGNPIGGPGGQCPPLEERACKVDCAFTWNAWGICDPQTGRQTRSPLITQTPIDGWNGQGKFLSSPIPFFFNIIINLTLECSANSVSIILKLRLTS
jgi:hypothetical protein